VPAYVALFEAAYPDIPRALLSFRDAANAIAAFQLEELTKTDSPFDRYLSRDDFALSTEEKEGALLFFGRARCSTCHSGPLLGAQQFANAGVPQIGPGMPGTAPLDLGRGEIDEHQFFHFSFRVAPLRNVELTAPYMHNGAYRTLEAVVDHYDDVRLALETYDVSQLDPAVRDRHHGDDSTITAMLASLDGRLSVPLDLTADEKRRLVSFLRSLTDPAARHLDGIAPSVVPSGLPMRD
jgi:cytochrome c peroxidase